MKRIMIDIETLGLDRDSVILSIGAIDCEHFNNQFYRELDITDQLRRTVDLNTLRWWLTQETPMPVHGNTVLKVVLEELTTFLLGTEEVWAKGPQFDFMILEHAFRSYQLQVPWKYNQVRDLRTLKSMYPGLAWAENTNKHNALSDARFQAEQLNRLQEYVDGKHSPVS